jgi:acetyltransferase-like isoleucine patch superfamily enzyme
MFETPILFIVFNRPNETKKVFDIIKNTRPKKIFIAADGPRPNVSSDIANCNLVKNIVSNIDWDCDIKTLYSEENLGCGLAVSYAINWFFENVDQGIILEDDCVPNSDFFTFCNEMLNYYKEELSVMHISGNCYADGFTNENYYFTRLPFIWGWATWKRAWRNYDFDLKYTSPEEKKIIIKKAFGNNEIVEYWDSILKDFHLSPESYTWDYQWFLTIWKNEGLVIQPNVNLVENIGFGAEATHTNSSEHYLGKVKAASYSMKSHNHKKEINSKFQNTNFNFYFNNRKKTTKLNWVLVIFNNLFNQIKLKIGELVYKFLFFYSEKTFLSNPFDLFKSVISNSNVSKKSKLYPVFKVFNSNIGDFTYVARNAIINNSNIGKFCSIGPNLIAGWGIHPIKGISTHPMFYSTIKQNGITLSRTNKIQEFKTVTIGNDVFIGMNVTILDGVTIGDGAIIGAGAIVSKDIPAYAIAVGNPINIIDFRFKDEIINRLLNIRWWDCNEKDLALVEKYFFDVEKFLQILENNKLKK